MVAGCALALALVFQAAAGEKNPLVGHYYLQGVTEVGSDIVLRENGRFEYGAAMGGYEESAAGTWRQTPQGVTLKADRDERPPSFTFVAGRASKDPDDKGSITVSVGNKAMGLVFSGMDVEFQFKSGKSFKGQTGRSGRLSLEGPFKGDKPTRVGIGYLREGVAMVWHDIQVPAHNVFEFEFNPGKLKAPLFDELELRVDKDALVRTMGEEPWRYEKR
jgi:uncharacterized cupin superfamily protein